MNPSPFESIEKIDRNFRSDLGSPDLEWIDAFDPRVAIRGLGWVHENRSFRRVPERVVPTLSAAVQQLSRCPSGGFIAFRTNADEIAVRMAVSDCKAMSHMPLAGSAGAELYLRENQAWIPVGTAYPGADNPVFERRLVLGMGNHLREYRLYLPLYKPLEALAIGVTPGARVEPVLSTRKPIVFYGTSITQGGCANTAGADYVSAIGRLMDYDTYNLGFSGNGKGEPEMARLIAEVDAAMFVIAYSTNCEVAELQATLPEFVRIIRKRHPLTPIVLQSGVAFSATRWNQTLRLKNLTRRDLIIRYYIEARDRGDLNLYFIDGEGLLPPSISGTTVDGLHPTNAGFTLMTQQYVPQLNMILAWEPRASADEPLRLAP